MMRSPSLPDLPPHRTAAMAAILVLASPALANMAEPPAPRTVRAGNSAGDLAGGLRDVRVVSERLVVDLRPLAEGRPARVEANYRVRNDGAFREVSLWFVADALTRGAREVLLDGRPLAAADVPSARLPAGWRAPATTPAPGAGAALPYRRGREGVIGFRARLEPGEHELTVRYPARPSAFQAEGLLPTWQLGYVLAPAREWGGFGTLDLRVEAPRGWKVLSTPALTARDGGFVGHWNGIPADAIALSARAPEPRSGWRYGLALVATLGGLVALFAIGRALGRWLSARQRSPLWVVLVAAAAATGFTMAALIAWLSVPEWVAWSAGEMVNRYEISRMSYAAGFALVLLLPLFLLLGFAAVLIPGLRGARRR